MILMMGGLIFTPTIGVAKTAKKAVSKKQRVKNLFKKTTKKKRKVASMGLLSDGGEAQTALKVRGQSRNLNMLLVLKSKQEKISFIKLKKEYNDEILNTNF